MPLDKNIQAELDALISKYPAGSDEPWKIPAWTTDPVGITLLKSLEDCPELSLFHDSLQALGNGMSAVSLSGLCGWMVERARRVGAAITVGDVERYLDGDSFQAFHIMLLDGLRPDAEYDLADDVQITTLHAVPKERLRDAGYSSLFGPLPLPDVTAVLISPFRHERRHVSQGSGEKPTPAPQSPLHDMKACLTLSRHGGVGLQTFASGVFAPDDVPMLAGSGWTIHSYRHPHGFSPPLIEVEASLTDELFKKFSALEPSAKSQLHIPVRRLSDFASTLDPVQGAIDLRIALESLFLDDRQRTELGFRLRLRAAVYLGTDGNDRKRIAKVVRDAYSLGSSAVHNGALSQKQLETARHVLPDAAEVVRLAVIKRLDDPAPEWDSIELGIGSDLDEGTPDQDA